MLQAGVFVSATLRHRYLTKRFRYVDKKNCREPVALCLSVRWNLFEGGTEGRSSRIRMYVPVPAASVPADVICMEPQGGGMHP